MGKRGNTWHDDNANWRLWRGAKSPSQRPWRGSQDSQFPTFDSEVVSLPENGREIARRELEAAGQEDASFGMLQDLQAMLNTARKAEGRFARACQAREQTKAQWQKFDARLKETFQKERRRYEQAMERHEKEVQAAREAQAAARELVRQARPMVAEAAPAPMEEEDLEWERMKAKWDAEQDRALGAVYRRAMAATFEAPVLPATSVGKTGATTAASDPYLVPGGGTPVASPVPAGARAGEPLGRDAASPPGPVRRDLPRTPRPEPYVPDKPQEAPDGSTREESLTERLHAAKRSALKPFHGACEKRKEDLPTAGPAGPSPIFLGDPDELTNAQTSARDVSPGLGKME
eukprot:s4840_g3.t1